MTKTESRPPHVVCLATFFKGVDFIRELKSHGCRVVVVTKEKFLEEDWPRDSLDDLFALPNDAPNEVFFDVIRHISKENKIDHVVALEEFDVILAALIREHLCLSGTSSSNASVFRDKLPMSLKAKAGGIRLPAFASLLNHAEVAHFMDQVPPPWILKPRSDASAIGIRKVEKPQEVWDAIAELDARERLGERSSYYLLAQFIPGEVFHVDSTVQNGRVVFAAVNRYGRPPMQVAHGGGAYISHTVAHDSADQKKLLAINKRLIKALGLEKGVTHAEFIKGAADEEFYFLEVASRVGGAYIAEVLEAASGVNLWREWARLEIGAEVGTKTSKPRKDYAGIVLSLARQDWPDTAAYDDPEIVYRVRKKHHVGLIVSSPKLSRVQELLDLYAVRFADDFIAIEPPLERADEALT